MIDSQASPRLIANCGVWLFLALIVVCVCRAQQPNRKFLIGSSRGVLVYDSKTKAIGPYTLVLSEGPGDRIARMQVSTPAGSSSISIHVKISPAKDGSQWKLVFLSSGVVKDTISSDSPRGRSSEAWSWDISGNMVTIELRAPSPPPGLSIVVDGYDHPVVPIVPQAITGKNQMKAFYTQPSYIQKLGSAVARLRIKTSNGEALCTGFLISDDLMLTNYHCIPTDIEAVNTRADFGYDKHDETGTAYLVQGIVVTNSDIALDYVVVRMMGYPGRTYSHVSMPGLGTSFFPILAPPLGSLSFSDSNRKLLVIEHPGGGPKMVSITDCAVAGDKMAGVDPQEVSDFGHSCDTLGGSSGSPVFSLDTNALVGLHHLGFAEGSGADDPLINQAVYVGYILEDIKKQDSTVFSEIEPAVKH